MEDEALPLYGAEVGARRGGEGEGEGDEDGVLHDVCCWYLVVIRRSTLERRDGGEGHWATSGK